VQREWGGRERVREMFGADDSDATREVHGEVRGADSDS